MQRHARLGAQLIIFVLALLAGVVSLTSPATRLTGDDAPAVSLATVAPHPDDDEVERAPAPSSRHLTAPALFGLLAEAPRPPAAGSASGGAQPRHHKAAAQQAGPRQGRAPPAITDR